MGPDLFSHGVVTGRGVVCLECRKPPFVAALRRHLRIAHDLTPDDYRRRWGLPPESPMEHPHFTQTGRSPVTDAWSAQ